MTHAQSDSLLPCAIRVGDGRETTRAVGRSAPKARYKFDDACGCGVGAAFMTIGLVVASIYYGFRFYTGQLSLSLALLRVFVATVAMAGAGKFAGIARYRLRRRKLALQSH